MRGGSDDDLPADFGEQSGIAPELRSFSASDLSGSDAPPREWHSEGLIPFRVVTLLMANGGDGKSTLALHLAVATATGGRWLGRDCKEGGAVYLSAEDDRDEVHRRLHDIAYLEQIALADMRALEIIPLVGEDAVLAAPDPRTGLLKTTAIYAALRAKLAKLRPILLILDTTADVFGGDEIKKIQVRQFIGLLQGLAIEFDLTVLLIGHPSQAGMSTGAGTSGNVAWSNSVRSRLYLERVRTAEGLEVDPNIRVLTVKKANYAPSGVAITLRWQEGVFVVEQGGAPAAGPGLAAHAEETFLDLLRQFEREGRNVSASPSNTYAPTLFAQNPRAAGVTKRQFTTAMNTLLQAARIAIEESGPPSKRRSKLVVKTLQPPPAV